MTLTQEAEAKLREVGPHPLTSLWAKECAALIELIDELRAAVAERDRTIQELLDATTGVWPEAFGPLRITTPETLESDLRASLRERGQK